MDPVTTHIFSNGLPAVYLQFPGTRVNSAIMLVGAGSRFETSELQGLTRFYANLCFQGNQHYPQKHQLDQAFDSLALTLRPTVSPEYTLWYFSSPPPNFIPSFELFIQTVFNPAMTDQGLQEEKTLNLQEADLTAKTPQVSGLNKLIQLMLNNQPLAFDPIGTSQGINNINLEVLTAFKNKFYVSHNCLLLIVGSQKNFDWTTLESLARHIPTGQRQIIPPYNFSLTKVIQEKETYKGAYSYLTFGSLCFGRNSEKRLAQSLLLTILGEGRNQRFWPLRKEKLVTAIRPWEKIGTEVGIFLTQASCLAEKEQQVLEQILNQFKGLGTGNITEDELQKAKTFYTQRLLERLDNSVELGIFYALGYFFNLAEETPEQVLEKINKITFREINEVAQSIFKPEAISYYIVGPGY